MDKRKIWTSLVAIALSIGAPAALPQAFPSKPVRFVVPWGAGGTPDATARLIAPRLAERFGQPVLVENRPGGDSIIGTEAVAKATPDGHTVLYASSLTILPHTRKQLPYDPFKDFVHVTQVANAQFVLAANPSVPAGSVAELIALARSRPGQLTCASSSETGHIMAEMLMHSTKVDIVHVPYKTLATATIDLLSGQVNIMFGAFAAVLPHLKTKSLKVLAVTGEKRSLGLPDVPTMSEAGVTGFESSFAWGISAPRGTPPAAVKRWSGEVASVLEMPGVSERFLALGLEPRSATSEQFTALLQAESEKYRVALQRIGFKPE